MSIPSYMRPTKASAAKQVDPASLPMNQPKSNPFYVGKYPRPTARKATPQSATTTTPTTVKVNRPPRSVNVFERLQEQTSSSAAKTTEKFESSALPFFYTGVKPFVLLPPCFQNFHRKRTTTGTRKAVLPAETVLSEPVFELHTEPKIPSAPSTPSLESDCGSNLTLFSKTDPDGSFELYPVDTRPIAETLDASLSFGEVSEPSIPPEDPTEKVSESKEASFASSRSLHGSPVLLQIGSTAFELSITSPSFPVPWDAPEIAEVRASFTLPPAASQTPQDDTPSAKLATITVEIDVSNPECLSTTAAAASSTCSSAAASVESTPRKSCASSPSPTQLKLEDNNSSKSPTFFHEECYPESCDIADIIEEALARRRLSYSPSPSLQAIEEEDREAPLQDATNTALQHSLEPIIKAPEDATSDLASEVSPAEIRATPSPSGVRDGILQFMLATQRPRAKVAAVKFAQPVVEEWVDCSDESEGHDVLGPLVSDDGNDPTSEDEAVARGCKERNALLPKYLLADNTIEARRNAPPPPAIRRTVVKPGLKGILKKRYDIYFPKSVFQQPPDDHYDDDDDDDDDMDEYYEDSESETF